MVRESFRNLESVFGMMVSYDDSVNHDEIIVHGILKKQIEHAIRAGNEL